MGWLSIHRGGQPVPTSGDKYVHLGRVSCHRPLSLHGECSGTVGLGAHGAMWRDDEGVINIACPQSGLEGSRGDGLLLDVFHEQIGNDGKGVNP